MNKEYKELSWKEIYDFNGILDNMEHDYKNKCQQLEDIRNYIIQSDLKNMLWGKELMKILDRKK